MKVDRFRVTDDGIEEFDQESQVDFFNALDALLRDVILDLEDELEEDE